MGEKGVVFPNGAPQGSHMAGHDDCHRHKGEYIMIIERALQRNELLYDQSKVIVNALIRGLRRDLEDNNSTRWIDGQTSGEPKHFNRVVIDSMLKF